MSNDLTLVYKSSLSIYKYPTRPFRNFHVGHVLLECASICELRFSNRFYMPVWLALFVFEGFVVKGMCV